MGKLENIDYLEQNYRSKLNYIISLMQMQMSKIKILPLWLVRFRKKVLSELIDY